MRCALVLCLLLSAAALAPSLAAEALKSPYAAWKNGPPTDPSFFPTAVRAAVGGARRVVVLEKALAVGIGGIVSANVRMATAGMRQHGYTVIAGLGGRAITRASLRDMLRRAGRDELEPRTFLDLNTDLLQRELDRAAAGRKSGPAAENML